MQPPPQQKQTQNFPPLQLIQLIQPLNSDWYRDIQKFNYSMETGVETKMCEGITVTETMPNFSTSLCKQITNVSFKILVLLLRLVLRFFVLLLSLDKEGWY